MTTLTRASYSVDHSERNSTRLALSDPVRFFQRRYPSANAALLTGPAPILVDPGFGADTAELVQWLARQGIAPGELALIVNTHFDCDHAGGNHVMARHGIPIAAHAIEADLVNRADADACRALWLNQPVEPYHVDQVLEEGAVLDTGAARWTVLHTPGHTPGHISLWHGAGVLVTGDAVHADDLGWLDPRDPGAIDMADATIARLASLPVRVAYSGHGGPTTDPATAFAAARRRLGAWRTAPDRLAWHGVKRVFAYALMLQDGLPEAALLPFLQTCPWATSYASTFGLSAAGFASALVGEMLRSGAARWDGTVLVAGSAFVPPLAGWARAATRPADWPGAGERMARAPAPG